MLLENEFLLRKIREDKIFSSMKSLEIKIKKSARHTHMWNVEVTVQ